MRSPDRVYRRRDGVALREVGDDIFLIDEKTGRIHHLNVTGAGLWRLLAEPVRMADIVRVFRDAFPDRTEKALRKKLRPILEDFEELDLLQDERA